MRIKHTLFDKTSVAEALTIFADSTHVNMHYKCTSSGPLYSDDFANCLAVIIHDEKTKSGCMMHIFPGLGGTTDNTALFYYVDREIELALQQFSSAENLSLLLLKGLSYSNSRRTTLPISYAEHAKKRFRDSFNEIVDMLDKDDMSPEPHILYDPASFQIFLIKKTNEDQFDAQLLKKEGAIKLPTLSPDDFQELLTKHPPISIAADEINEEFVAALALNSKTNINKRKIIKSNKLKYAKVHKEIKDDFLDHLIDSENEVKVNNNDNVPATNSKDNQELKSFGSFSLFVDEGIAYQDSEQYDMESFLASEEAKEAEDVEDKEEVEEADEMELNTFIKVNEEDIVEEKKLSKGK